MSERNIQPPIPTDEELIEARERADAGLRLAFPQLFEQLETDAGEAGEMSRGDGLGAADGTDRLVAALNQQVDVAEFILGLLGARVEDHTLPAAVVGRIGIKLGEVREQLPALREAVADRSGS